MKRNTKLEKALITAFERGYKVSKNGELLNPKGNTLKGSKTNKGYKSFTLLIDEEMLRCFVHHLQAYQKYGDKIFEVDCVRHLNGNKLDNSFKNIDLGSNHDNQMDIPEKQRKINSRLGIEASIEKRRTFTDNEVITIWKDWKENNLSHRELAKNIIHLKVQ